MRRMPLKPSILILHDVSTTGNVSYKTTSRTVTTDEKKEEVIWTTTREILDKPEHDKCRALRARIKTLLKTKTSGAISDIGLFAPDIPRTFEKIEEAEKDIIAACDDFNSTAFYSRIQSQIITFQITSDNLQALQAVSNIITNGLNELKEATAAANPEGIRAALNNMKGLDSLLPDAKSAELKSLMESMRKRARDITKAVKKAGRKLDADELVKFQFTSNITAAEMKLFDETPDAELIAELDATQNTGATAQEFTLFDEITPTPGFSPAPTIAPTAAEFTPDTTSIPTPEQITAAEKLISTAQIQPDTTPDYDTSADFEDLDNDEGGDENPADTEPELSPSEISERRALLIEIYENSDADTRAEIKAELDRLNRSDFAKV